MVLEQIQDFEPLLQAKFDHFESVSHKILLYLEKVESDFNEAIKHSQKDKVAILNDDISKQFSYFKLFSTNVHEFEAKYHLNENGKQRINNIKNDVVKIKNYFSKFNSSPYTLNLNEQNENDVNTNVNVLNQINQDNAILLQRQMEIENLAHDLHSVENLGKELANSILEQGMKIDSIESNSDKSSVNFAKGVNSLKTIGIKVMAPALATGIFIGAPVYVLAGMTAGIISGITSGTLIYIKRKSYNRKISKEINELMKK